MAAIPAEAFDLEAKRGEDGSWHPCRVSLSSNDTSFGIIVDFKDGTEEDIISDRGDVLARLRHRSTPLQAGECFHIKEEEHVLVMHKDRSRSLFFDAVVEKSYKVKHSSRVYCRCTFEVKWLNPKLGGETKIVSSNSIMRLSHKGIDSHPVLASFLNTLNPIVGPKVPLFAPCFEELNYEDELHELDRQIEEISKLADESSMCSRDILFDIKGVDLSGHAQNKAVSSIVNSLNNQKNIRRSTRRQNKLHTEMELKEESKEKPLLSPLAARAALALSVQELPQLPEYSINHEFLVDLSAEDPKKQIEVQPLDANHILFKYDVLMPEKVSIVSNLDRDTKCYMLGRARDDYKSSIPYQKDTMKKSKENESSELRIMEEKPVQASREVEEIKIYTPSTNSGDSEMNGEIITRRLTRSAFQKEKSIDKMDQQLSSKKFNKPVNSRSRRSMWQKEDNSSNVKQGVAERSSTESEQAMSVYDPVTPEKNEINTKRSISSSVDTDMDSAPERKKGTRASSITIANEEDQGEILQEESSRAKKRKSESTKKPVLRFSARLNKFLPRTRSQMKS